MNDSVQLFSLAYLVLPTSILESFDIVRCDLESESVKSNELYSAVVHIHLDEKKDLPPSLSGLRPNGFTEPTVIEDFPIRDRKVLLHVRRRRWIDADGHNVIVNTYPLVHDGTRYSPEFAAFLKGIYGECTGDLFFYCDPVDDIP